LNTYEQIASYNSLLNGFYRVKESDGAPGLDGISIDDFEDDLQNNINLLYKKLISHTYKPGLLLTFERKTSTGKIRLLNILNVCDRVAQAAALYVLEPIIDAELERESFAYRKGYSREAAARRIHYLYKKGYCWILDADIEKFFDRIDHSILIKKLNSIIHDSDVIELIRTWIEPEYLYKNKKLRQSVGLPQGAVISPILANLYLDNFDEQISKSGLKLVRFADDFIILTKSKPAAAEALKISAQLLSEVKLELNAEKTRLTTFDNGFKYLGYLFVKSLIVPASPDDKSRPLILDNNESAIEIERFKELTAEKQKVEVLLEKLKSSDIGIKILEAVKKKGVPFDQFINSLQKKTEESIPNTLPIDTVEAIPSDKEPVVKEKSKGILPNSVLSFKRTLYIQNQGAELRKENQRFIVQKEDKTIGDYPAVKINQIIIFGNCQISPAVMQFCLINNIPITLLSSYGKYYGRLESTEHRNHELELLQYLFSLNEKFTLDFSKRIISAKVNNTRILLQRANKRRDDSKILEAINEIKILQRKIEKSGSAESLRGVEGALAAVYFSVFGRLFLKETGFFLNDFKRIKRPPTDPINSLLSFGYTLLNSNIHSFLHSFGLHPYVGFFHVIKEGHAALASDLIEEFRHIIDSLVIQVINKGILKRTDFYFAKEPGLPCFLKNEARKEFLRQFEIKMHKITTHTPTGIKADYRRCISLQIKQLTQLLRGEKNDYIPITSIF